jgi:hypothetical protein
MKLTQQTEGVKGLEALEIDLAPICFHDSKKEMLPTEKHKAHKQICAKCGMSRINENANTWKKEKWTAWNLKST